MNIYYGKTRQTSYDEDMGEEESATDDYSSAAPPLQDMLTNEGRVLTLHLNNEVSDLSLNDVINHILQVNMGCSQHPDVEQINLMITSPGGSLKTAQQLLTVMDGSAIPIRTVAWSELSSAAVLIFMAGHERLVSEHAIIMSHNASCATPPFPQHVEDGSAEQMRKMIDSQMRNAYMKYTGKSIAYIRANLLKRNRSDVYIDGLKCIDHGIADKQYTRVDQLNIIMPKRF